MWIRRLFLVAFWMALVFAFVMAVLPQPPALPGAPTDKTQHVLAFVTLTALARFAYPQARVVTLILAFALFGALIELVQLIPALHRTADVADWAADVAATLATLAVVEPLRRWAMRRRSAPEHVIDERGEVAKAG